MHNKLIFIILIVVIAGGVWYGLSISGAPEPLLVTTTPEGTSVSAQSTDQEIIGTLLALRAVTLSGSIFSDPSFVTLQDFGTTIVPEPVGRENPFAPLRTAAPASAGAGAAKLFTPSGR
ncbi:MAG: hypothetical protein Athens041674_198 [Parcubacteria group bacterium Athens0416_74]|nr:MAG: hypothetical protein Athens041674_198 [Parcubacteria group bacterium Athens0416_74]